MSCKEYVPNRTKLTQYENIKIRELEKQDIENGFLETLDELVPTNLDKNKALKIFEKIQLNQNHRIDVAINNSRVIGVCTLVFEQKFIHGGSMICHAEDLAIAKDWQKKGIGMKLFQHELEIARNLGCYKIIFSCLDENMEFYTKIGGYKCQNSMRIDL